MIDFENPEVRETIGKVAAETGMSLEELIKQYEYAEKHKTYVRFTIKARSDIIYHRMSCSLIQEMFIALMVRLL